VADTFTGFGEPETLVSVMILQLPGPVAEVTAGFTPERMAAHGWTMRSQQTSSFNGTVNLMVSFEQPLNGTRLFKWARIFGNSSNSTMLMATMPIAQQAKYSEPLKAVLENAQVTSTEKPTAEALIAALSFQVDVVPGLKAAVPVNGTLLCTRDGELPVKSATEPLVVVSVGAVKVASPLRRTYAENRIQKTALVSNLVITSVEPLRAPGISGFAIIATAKDSTTGDELTVYQAMLFDDSGYLILVGMVGNETSAEHLKMFSAMARTLRRNR
jgi:hypothetical protein